MIHRHFYLIVFDGTHAALKAEAVFKERNVKVKIIPLPSSISAGCGFSIKVLPSEKVEVEALLKQSLFEWSNLYEFVKVGSENKVENWELIS